MPTARTSQNIDAVNFKEQAVDPAAPGAGYGEIFRTVAGWQERVAANASSLLMAGGFPCDGRLTLTTLLPVTTANVTNAATMYFTPYKGNRITLYDGTRWRLYSFSEKSLALSGHTLNVPADVFIYDNAGTLTLEFTNWTSGTARATGLSLQDGVYCKTGALTRRYLGTFNPTAATTTDDSDAKRFVWNYYNRVERFMKANETTNSWTYSLATYRQANNVTTTGVTRVECVVGVSEDLTEAMVQAVNTNSATTVLNATGIGINSITVNSASVVGAGAASTALSVQPAHYAGYLPVGYNYIQWLENAQATGTTTWYGDNGGTIMTPGMIAKVMA